MPDFNDSRRIFISNLGTGFVKIVRERTIFLIFLKVFQNWSSKGHYTYSLWTESLSRKASTNGTLRYTIIPRKRDKAKAFGSRVLPVNSNLTKSLD